MVDEGYRLEARLGDEVVSFWRPRDVGVEIPIPIAT
jgi:hypothetical protein